MYLRNVWQMITPLGNANDSEIVSVELTLNLAFLKISLSKEMSIPILHLKPNATQQKQRWT